MIFSEQTLRDAHKHAFGNRPEIERSRMCGCFSCYATFDAGAVWDWVQQVGDEAETGFCPYCTLDTVLADASGLPVVDQNFLKAMNKLFFDGPPFFDQTVDPHEITGPRDWKCVDPDHAILERGRGRPS